MNLDGRQSTFELVRYRNKWEKLQDGYGAKILKIRCKRKKNGYSLMAKIVFTYIQMNSF